MNLDVSIGAALLGGIISFLSPCVLPLVPPYLCFITGASLDELSQGATVQRRRAIFAALAFVAGFSTVFVALGASASWIGQALRSHLPLLALVLGIGGSIALLIGFAILD
jgi:cytochrome c-type biogenesis protein